MILTFLYFGSYETSHVLAAIFSFKIINQKFHQLLCIFKKYPYLTLIITSQKHHTMNLSKLMSTAWSIFKAEMYDTFSECLKAAWRKYKFLKKLKSEKLSFAYKTIKGEVREAIGTLMASSIDYSLKGTNKTENLTIVKYWDLERLAFRSFRINNLITS